MKYLFIAGNRRGYSPEQCGKTMTVRELIDYLDNNFEEESLVYLSNDNGYTYGSITERDFEEENIEEDEEVFECSVCGKEHDDSGTNEEASCCPECYKTTKEYARRGK